MKPITAPIKEAKWNKSRGRKQTNNRPRRYKIDAPKKVKK